MNIDSINKKREWLKLPYLKKATSHGQGFLSQPFINSEYHQIMTSALLVKVINGQNLNMTSAFWEP